MITKYSKVLFTGNFFIHQRRVIMCWLLKASDDICIDTHYIFSKSLIRSEVHTDRK